jgi:hypothetical protein
MRALVAIPAKIMLQFPSEDLVGWRCNATTFVNSMDAHTIILARLPYVLLYEIRNLIQCRPTSEGMGTVSTLFLTNEVK